jgi:integrase
VEWALQQGYAMGTVNVRLATLRKYCTLAGPSPEGVDILDRETLLLIQTVKGISGKKARNRDREREADGIAARKGTKKAAATPLTTAQALALKKATSKEPRGTQKRDAALIGLMIEHALRCGEVASLNIENIDLAAGTMKFYREKTDQEETHTLHKHTFMALESYLAEEHRTSGPLFLGNQGKRLSRRAINARVTVLGRQVGIDDTKTLSPHDLRHFWAFDALRNKTSFDRVKSGGGWKSDSMVMRYAQRAGIANEGVIISEEA